MSISRDRGRSASRDSVVDAVDYRGRLVSSDSDVDAADYRPSRRASCPPVLVGVHERMEFMEAMVEHDHRDSSCRSVSLLPSVHC